MSAGNNATYSAELTERMKLKNDTSAGFSMKFKSPANRNVAPGIHLDRNV